MLDSIFNFQFKLRIEWTFHTRTTSRLLVGIASFVSALIEYKYGRSVGRSSNDYYTLSPEIGASGNDFTISSCTLAVAWWHMIDCLTSHNYIFWSAPVVRQPTESLPI